MKYCWMSILALTMMTGMAYANEPVPKHSRGDNVSLGFEITETAGDFGLGLQLTSPTFAEVLAIRAAGDLAYFKDGQNDQGESVSYAPYYTARLGIMTSAGWPTQNIRAYTVGGVLLVIPNSEFSGESTVIGGYGIIGFEFFLAPDTGWSYFIEGSGIGTGAKADKIAGDPNYQNGFRAGVGVRYSL